MLPRMQARRWAAWMVTLVGVLSVSAGMPSPASGQQAPSPSVTQLAELEEAERLNQQVIQLYNQGQYSTAMPLAERVLAIRERVLGPEHPDVAESLNNLAELYRAQGNYAQAEPSYQRSLAIFEKVLGPEHPDVATALNNLAELYRAQGNYAQAEPLYQRSLAIREKVLGPEHPDVAISLNNLAVLYQAQGNYAQAEPLYQRSLAIREKVLGPEHPDVAISLNNLAALYQAQGNSTRAIAFLTRSSNIEERNLDRLLTTVSEARKRAYLATLSGRTNATLSFHLQGAANDPQAARLALTTILRRKGRVLDSLTDNLQILRRNLTPPDQTLLDQLAANRTQLATLTFKGLGNTPPDQYRTQLKALEDQAQALEDTLSRRSAEFRTETQPVTIEAVQKLIPADAALVELVRYQPFNAKATTSNDRWGSPRYAAYVLHTQGNPQWVDLGEAAAINQAAANFRRIVQNSKRTPEEVKRAARSLDELLLRPVRKLLGNRRQLLLSPDSDLNLIPFAALVDEHNRYLVETYSISYLSSGRDLLRLQAQTPSQQAPVLFANPDFDQPGRPLPIASTRSSPDNRRSADLSRLQFGPLPGTAQEASEIAKLLPGMQVLSASQASENALKQLHGPRLLHIATHGFFLPSPPPSATRPATLETGLAIQPPEPPGLENPLLRSGLALAGFNRRTSGSEDGVLTALEAAGLDLRGTQLVVLSACDTGLGEVANGEGIYGLRRALVIAGAESQLISLWQVDDFGTKDLMLAYYHRLLANQGRSEALRQTQLALLNTPQYQHPYYWASFIASGAWQRMKNE